MLASSLSLHPGVEVALARFGMNEQQVARAIACGDLASPQKFENSELFSIRITGTGRAYREALNEHVWRDPAYYLHKNFVARCNGLPVVWEHPKSLMLDGKEFQDRIIGTIIYPFIGRDGVEDPSGTEVWGIARILDPAAAELMREEKLSTSPGVVFRKPSEGTAIDIGDGEHLLIEGDPVLLDHIAVCDLGVWDRDGPPEGIAARGDTQLVLNDSNSGDIEEGKMAERDDARREEDMATDSKRDDAVVADTKGHGETIEKVLAGLDSIAQRFDAMNSRFDALSSRLDTVESRHRDDRRGRDDAEEEEEEKKERSDRRTRDDRRGRDDRKKRDDDDPEEEKRQAAELERLAAEEREEGKEAEEEERDDKKRGDRRTRNDRGAHRRDDESEEEHSKRVDAYARHGGLHRFRRNDGETCDAHSKRITSMLHRNLRRRGDAEEDKDEEKERDDSSRRPNSKLNSRADESEEEKERGDRRHRDDGERSDRSRRDTEEEEEEKERERDDRARRARDDAARAREDAAKARADAQALRERLDRLERGRPVDEQVALSEIQSRFDAVLAAHGDQAPRPMDGESPLAYRRRLIRKVQSHSGQWKEYDFTRADAQLLDIAEPQVRTDAIAAAKNPASVPRGMLREVKVPREGGGHITEWYGDPMSWMGRFMLPPRFVSRIGKQD
jgi:hypothetical protein